MKKNLKQILVVALIIIPFLVNAQDLAGAIDEATDELSSIFSSLKLFLFALAGIVALYGGFNVYSKYQAQDQDAAKAAAKYGFAFIFLMASAFLVEAIFL